MIDEASVDTAWAAYTEINPVAALGDEGYSAWHFCDNEADADELAELVRIGRKCATAGALWSYEYDEEPLPRVGDFSVITNWAGTAICIIRTTEVEIVPFDAVTAEFAAAEGEGDGSLQYWRAVHRQAFARELSLMGKVVEDDMPVVCERFELVFDATALAPDGDTDEQDGRHDAEQTHREFDR